MRAFLEVLSGPKACRRLRLTPGEEVYVGRTDEAQVVIASDRQMSGVHFAVAFDGTSCRVRDLESQKGTLLEGEAIRDAEVCDGDTLIAGETWFRVRLRPPWGGGLSAEEKRLPEPLVRGVVEALRTQGAPRFAIVDAARDEGVLALLRESDSAYQSLYEGLQGQVMAEQAPYLVELGGGSSFDEVLVRRGWGKSWGVYLTSREPFRELRRHLRKFLFVKDEAGRELYFRFYDPRVLRVFLPTCSPRQAGAFFEGVEAFSMEGERAEVVLRFSEEEGRLRREIMTLASGDDPSSPSAMDDGV
jgi:Domain of unknown function (DUF4123)/Inner membrane component of T3SS, cytoplasmic domain